MDPGLATSIEFEFLQTVFQDAGDEGSPVDCAEVEGPLARGLEVVVSKLQEQAFQPWELISHNVGVLAELCQVQRGMRAGGKDRADPPSVDLLGGGVDPGWTVRRLGDRVPPPVGDLVDGHGAVAVEGGEVVLADLDEDLLADKGTGDRVVIITHLDVGILADPVVLPGAALEGLLG